MSKTQECWNKKSEHIVTNPKWLKKGTFVTVVASNAPQDAVVEGQFGKRKVNIIQTKEYGLVYVDDITLVKIVDRFKITPKPFEEDIAFTM